ncbi:DUF4402 domain-containing protein [Erythrobacter sp. JK5]|uniref:DUF4402 domain-containing protein n=1 Tax=Erythrobacter sp. JK5 TaxID=2829500 RepID=UPI001BAC7A23|nr:DUF4402 domain-containing protein [Erythrobacter sp. JK5]QUL37038.1 DUF4402 domain-containing protein [Erythrobacter sp. JK5]
MMRPLKLRWPRRTGRLLTGSISLAVAGFALSVSPASAQDTASVPTAVRLQGDTRITKLGDLDFGDILPGASGGTITVAVDSTVSTSGTVQSLNSGQQAASFEITRQILADFPTYVGPGGSDTIQLVNQGDPTATMTLRNFTTDFNRTIIFGLPAYLFRTTYDFRVGGTLDVAADQEPGSYLGTFVVTIDYN